MKDRGDRFYRRMHRLVGEEAPLLVDSLRTMPPKSIRFNSRQSSLADVEKSGTAVPWCSPYGRYWGEEILPSRTIEYACGKYYIQDAGAMLAVAASSRVIDFSHQVVLDIAAAPGGKTTQAAELIQTGFLVANEIDPNRTEALTWNINRHRLNNTIVTSIPTHLLAAALPAFFDIVIADAPCSGEGLFQKRKHSLAKWSEKNVKTCASRQKSILKDAALLLRPGGYLIYSTCTFSPEENEDQVEFLLRRGFGPVSLPGDLPVSPAISDNENVLKCSRRIFPHREQGAGAFVAVLQKEHDFSPINTPGTAAAAVTYSSPGSPLLPLKTDDAFYLLTEAPGGYFYEKGPVIHYFSHPRVPSFLFEKNRQLGVPIFDKRRPFEIMFGSVQVVSPSACLEISRPGAEKYIKGEDLHLDCPDGIRFVVYNGMILGPVYVRQCRAVNRFPNCLASS